MINNGLTKGTSKTYSFLVKSFLARFSEMNSFNFKQLLNALSGYLRNSKNTSYRNLILASIKKYYKYLIDDGIRIDNPIGTMQFKTRRNRKIIHCDLFSTAELQVLLKRKERYSSLKWRNRVIITFLIYQALRVQELENLKIQHINLCGGNVLIKSTPIGKKRYLDLHPDQNSILDCYLRNSRNKLLRQKSDKLIIGMRGKPITRDQIHYFISTFKPLFLDRNLTADTIRQSVISNWINEKNIPLDQVQLLAGHSWISTTEKYRHPSLERIRAIINQLHPLNTFYLSK